MKPVLFFAVAATFTKVAHAYDISIVSTLQNCDGSALTLGRAVPSDHCAVLMTIETKR